MKYATTWPSILQQNPRKGIASDGTACTSTYAAKDLKRRRCVLPNRAKITTIDILRVIPSILLSQCRLGSSSWNSLLAFFLAENIELSVKWSVIIHYHQIWVEPVFTFRLSSIFHRTTVTIAAWKNYNCYVTRMVLWDICDVMCGLQVSCKQTCPPRQQVWALKVCLKNMDSKRSS